MDRIRNSTSLSSPRAIGAFVAANLLPLAGFAAGNWTLDALGALYWLEIGVVLFWSVAKSLFAERVFEFTYRGPGVRVEFDGLTTKRGGIEVAEGWPTLYPRNVPNLLPYVTGFAWFWLVLGAVVVTSPFNLPPWSELARWRTVGLLAVAGIAFLGRGFEARDVYVGEQQYETCSVGPLNRQAIEYSVVVGLLAVATQIETDEVATLFGLLVACKFGYELLRHRPGKLHWWANHLTRLTGHDPPKPEPTYLDPSTGDPDVEATPDDRAVSRASVVHAAFSDLLMPYWVFFALIAGFSALTVAAAGEVYDAPLLLLGFLVPVTLYVLVALVPLKVAEYVANHGSMRYEIRDRELVGYDDRLDETQWRIGFDDITDVSVETGLVDRMTDTRTVEVRADDRTVRLVHLSDADEVYDRLRYLGT